jgi:hypothetical protein
MFRTADTDGGHVKKLLALAAGSAAAICMALITAGYAFSDVMDVSGQTYGQAVALLKAQGYKAVFGGSVGSDVPQPQCVVQSQKVLPMGRISLMLNCTKAAAAAAAASQPAGQPGAPGAVPGAGAPPGAPHVGANGVTTVTPTPVGPQPGMNVGGG